MTVVPQPLIAALSEPAPGAETNPALERVLDAALAQFEDIGIRRSTVADIARRAGVDRVTVYRRVGSKEDLIQAVVVREVRRLIDEVVTASESLPTFEARVVAGFTTVIQQVRTNTLYNRLLALEADTVFPRMTSHAGPLLTMGVAATVGLIDRAQEDGVLGPVTELQAVAEVLVRIIHSCILTPQAAVTLKTDDELSAFARTQLVPIVTRSSEPLRPAD